jgi:hypothetical protein
LVIPRLQVGQVAVNICRCLDYACVKQLNPHTNTPLAAVLQALQSTAAVPFAEAHPLPAAVNHSLEFLDCERRAVFEQEWICVGRDLSSDRAQPVAIWQLPGQGLQGEIRIAHDLPALSPPVSKVRPPGW